MHNPVQPGSWRCLFFSVLLGLGAATPALPAESSGPTITGVFVDVSKLCHDPKSNGDSWDYIWADDDNLYSFACDSRGYGKAYRNLNFNKLTGTAWNSLTGSIVNAMDEYGTQSQKWANEANWKITGGDCIDGVIYAFVENHWYGADRFRRQIQ